MPCNVVAICPDYEQRDIDYEQRDIDYEQRDIDVCAGASGRR